MAENGAPDPLAVLRRRVQAFIDSPLASKCIGCGHADQSHNELGYCRVRSKTTGECPCETGTSIRVQAAVILRDLPPVAPLLGSPENPITVPVDDFAQRAMGRPTPPVQTCGHLDPDGCGCDR